MRLCFKGALAWDHVADDTARAHTCLQQYFPCVCVCLLAWHDGNCNKIRRCAVAALLVFISTAQPFIRTPPPPSLQCGALHVCCGQGLCRLVLVWCCWGSNRINLIATSRPRTTRGTTAAVIRVRFFGSSGSGLIVVHNTYMHMSRCNIDPPLPTNEATSCRAVC